MEKIKALFFAANPVLTSRISLDEEIRAITEKIHASKHHDSIELLSALAVQPDDLLQKLNEYKPQIVHFSAHGNPEGELILQDKNGKPKPVSARAIHALLKTLKENIRVVILNACYSQVQAWEIKNVIDCVIGMKSSISDKAAIIFSASFYRAIGFGCSINDAFEQGKAALLLEGIPEVDIPELLVKEGADPSHIFILETTPKKDVETENETGIHPPEKYFSSEENENGLAVKGVRSILVSIGHPFWIFTVTILVSPAVYRFFSNDYSIMYDMVKIELSFFWGIYVLFVFYLIPASFGQLRKKVEDIRTKGLLVTLKASILQFFREMSNKPMQLLSRSILFLLCFIVIMESDYFSRSCGGYYRLYKVLVPVIAVLSIALIRVKPGKRFKMKISVGIKNLSVAIFAFLILFPGGYERSVRRYFEWVDHNLFLDLVKVNPDLYRKSTIEKFVKEVLSPFITKFSKEIQKTITFICTIKLKKPIKPPKYPPNPVQNTARPIFTIETITIEADATGKDYDEACANAKAAALQKYYADHPQNTSELKEGEYDFEKCSFIKRLSNGQVRVIVTLKISIKKEEK